MEKNPLFRGSSIFQSSYHFILFVHITEGIKSSMIFIKPNSSKLMMQQR